MTEQKLNEEVRRLHLRAEAVMREIATLARAVVPMLKDHKLDNVAHGFEEKLFEMDALDQEMVNLARDNMDLFIALLTGKR